MGESPQLHPIPRRNDTFPAKDSNAQEDDHLQDEEEDDRQEDGDEEKNRKAEAHS